MPDADDDVELPDADDDEELPAAAADDAGAELELLAGTAEDEILDDAYPEVAEWDADDAGELPASNPW